MVVHNSYDEIEGGGFLGEMLWKFLFFFNVFLIENREENLIIRSCNGISC